MTAGLVKFLSITLPWQRTMKCIRSAIKTRLLARQVAAMHTGICLSTLRSFLCSFTSLLFVIVVFSAVSINGREIFFIPAVDFL